MLRQRIELAMPEIFGGAGLKPFHVSRLETELVVYNDGTHFRPHYDTFRDGAAHSDRLLTGVYYFHAEPKGFTGGELRLYRFGATEAAPGDYVDIEPEQNTLLVFPSWSTHEVRTVHCPSGRYGDSRFAMNCWLERARPVTA
ncbi:MAG: 2OG-Fe(II) oxygenase [Allosphingosinicella sp.]